jgi:hypothetical protein
MAALFPPERRRHLLPRIVDPLVHDAELARVNLKGR